MNDSADKLKEFSDLIEEHRPREAFVLFLKHVEDKSWRELKKPALAMLDTLCQRALPELREHYTLWMVNHPDRLRRMLELLTEALAVNYRRAATVDQIAWLRCLLAIAEAMAGRVEHVHEELCLIRAGPELDSIPEPNGTFRKQVQSIELTERTSIEFLKQFFASYAQFLKRVGQYELCNYMESRIGNLLGCIAHDEKQPGVVQALFYDKVKAIGHSGFIHVAMERQPHTGDEVLSGEAIEYASKKTGIIDVEMREAAGYTRQAVDAFLKRTGYPDGLAERLIRWEIATVRGDVVKLERQFQGGSVAMPLAVGIISEYLARSVPNDIALTGAFTGASITEGHILPVDGMPEKVKHAVLSGYRLIYVPTANFAELNGKPALRDLIKEHNARIVAVETLDNVCEELFPPEGSGRLRDTIKDTGANFMQILCPFVYLRKHALAKRAHERHRIHIIACSILTAVLVFLESWRICKAFAPDYPHLGAWTRIIASTILVLAGMGVSFALPAACLRHLKAWSWYAGIVVLSICFAAGVLLVGPMLPDFTSISSIYNAPPVAGLVKDMFLIWIFTWAIAGNTFNAVAALEDLVAKRQFVTARLCLRWDSPLEARMPLRCVHFPWKWGFVSIGVAAGYLIVLELNYYSSLDMSTVAAYWETFLGIIRDVLFGAALVEVMLFYKTSVATIREAVA